nr:putative ribonuclease H-like domain-containing protein [Tanacetum cinerariifolium]
MNYLEEQTDGEEIINCIKHGDQPLPRVTQVSIAGTSSTEQPPLKDKSMWSDQEKEIKKIGRLARSLLIQGLSNDIYSLMIPTNLQKTFGMLLLDICLVLKMKKTIVVTSDPLALIVEEMKVSKKEKVVVSSDSKGSDADDFSELKNITDLLAKAFNRRKFYSKPINNNLRTSSASQSANKKQEYVKLDDKKVKKKDDEKNDSDQEINANKVFMTQIEKVLSDSEASSLSADDKISKKKTIMVTSDPLALIVEEMKHVRTDNGTEFKNKTLAKFFDEVGITQQFSAARTPQQNGVVERRNRTLVEAARTMLTFANLPSFLWAEAIVTDFDKIDSPFQQTSSLKPYIPNVILEKIIIDLEDEVFLGTVRFGFNDFAVIASYGDVVNGLMIIKKVYYVEGLGHNLFRVGQVCDKGLEVAFRKSTCFVQTEDGVDLLTGDHSSNLNTITLNEVASNSSACLLVKASSSWLWQQRLSHLNFVTINNLVKKNIVQGLPKMKFEKDHL